MKLTHINEQGRARMVDVTEKPVTFRTAEAEGWIRMAPETAELIRTGGAPKGDVLAVAQVAGVLAAKRTHELIPMCHPLRLTGVDIRFALEEAAVHIRAQVKCKAVSAAALTVYDMCKAVQKDMAICDIRLCRKTGGKSGDYEKEW